MKKLLYLEARKQIEEMFTKCGPLTKEEKRVMVLGATGVMLSMKQITNITLHKLLGEYCMEHC